MDGTRLVLGAVGLLAAAGMARQISQGSSVRLGPLFPDPGQREWGRWTEKPEFAWNLGTSGRPCRFLRVPAGEYMVMRDALGWWRSWFRDEQGNDQGRRAPDVNYLAEADTFEDAMQLIDAWEEKLQKRGSKVRLGPLLPAPLRPKARWTELETLPHGIGERYFSEANRSHAVLSARFRRMPDGELAVYQDLPSGQWKIITVDLQGTKIRTRAGDRSYSTAEAAMSAIDQLFPEVPEKGSRVRLGPLFQPEVPPPFDSNRLVPLGIRVYSKAGWKVSTRRDRSEDIAVILRELGVAGFTIREKEANDMTPSDVAENTIPVDVDVFLLESRHGDTESWKSAQDRFRSQIASRLDARLLWFHDVDVWIRDRPTGRAKGSAVRLGPLLSKPAPKKPKWSTTRGAGWISFPAPDARSDTVIVWEVENHGAEAWSAVRRTMPKGGPYLLLKTGHLQLVTPIGYRAQKVVRYVASTEEGRKAALFKTAALARRAVERYAGPEDPP